MTTTAPTRVGRAARTPSVWLVPGFAYSDLNPLDWLGDAAAEAAGQAWTSAMIAAWSSAMWVLELAFTSLDGFTTPDLAADGPMGAVYPVTFGIGLVVALAMGLTQIGVAAIRRDGASLARVLIGVVQFGAVWLGYVGIAAALVTAASRLTHGLLESLLGIGEFTAYTPAAGWPEQVTDTVTATVLGLCAWLLIWPAALMHILVMVVREAALLLLVATSPIAAGGLLSEVGRAWFWKSLRWLVAALLIAPLSALVLGVGTRITRGVLAATPSADTTASSGPGSETAIVGMAVVGSVLLLVGALCPLILFRLLAFVDPGTSSGAAMRSSLASHGGLSGTLKGHTSSGGGSSVAAQGDGAGRSAGEASGEAATSSRFAAAGSGSGAGAGAGAGSLAGVGAAAGAAAGVVAAGVAAAGKAAHGAVALGSDVLSSSGVGHAHPYYPPYPADPRPPSNGSAPALGPPAAPAAPPPTSGGTPPAVVGADTAGAPPNPESPDPQPESRLGSDDTGTTAGGRGSGS